MAKLTELTTASIINNEDLLMLVDVSDSTMDASGTNKQITFEDLKTSIGDIGSGGITWNNVVGTTASATANNGYVISNSLLTTVTLPPVAAVGEFVQIQGSGAGGWRLAQNASQSTAWDAGGVAGVNVTTTGTAGNISSTDRYDSIGVMCIVANTGWVVRESKGNLNIN